MCILDRFRKDSLQRFEVSRFYKMFRARVAELSEKTCARLKKR